MKHPTYLSPAGYAAAAAFIKQALDPERYPEPDYRLLLVEPVAGPITHVELVTLPDGRPQVAVSIHGRNPRYLDPLDYAAIRLGTAFGMGLHCIDTKGERKGLAYPRFRAANAKGRAILLLRVLTNAQPWEVARQRPAEGPRTDYHHLSRRGLSKHSVRKFWDDDKPSRVPRVGRKEFHEAVEWYWHRNHLTVRIPVTLPDHLGLIRTALEGGDRT